MRGRILLVFKFLLLVLGIGILVFTWESLPVISGYGAKVVCSGVFVAGRQPEDVKLEDLASWPMSLASCTIDERDSSVTATVWDWLSERQSIARDWVLHWSAV